MDALLAWLKVVVVSELYAWAPALLLSLCFISLALYKGWRWKSLWFVLGGPVVVMGVAAVWGFMLPMQPTAPQGNLRIAHLNAYVYNDDIAPKLAFAANSGADVISLVEVLPPLVEAAQSISATYPYQVATTQGKTMLLLSKYPLTVAQDFPAHRLRLYHVARPQGAFYVLQGHVQSPSNPRLLKKRIATMAILTEKMPRFPKPLVAVGDINTVPWDEAIKPLTTNLTLAGGWRAWLPSFPTRVPLTPIDHLFVSPQFKAYLLQRIRVPTSDHLGLVMDFEFNPAQ
jgi:endonuclease/exonuclease/phosphatase (EEP) superfamily protein YafD